MKNIIRLATANDASQILSIYGPFCGQSPVSFEIVAPSVEEMARRISGTTERYPWLVYERDGIIRGYVYAGRHHERAAYRWSVDVAVYIHSESRGQGLGKALYSVLFDLLRCQGLYKAYAGITMPNKGSVALHRSLGFSMVGVYHGVGYKEGTWHDVSWWEVSLQPEKAGPAEPLTMADIVDTKLWKETILQGENKLNSGNS